MKIFDTRTRRKTDFVPLTPGKVGMYVCGPTVYHYFHIGNARCFTIFDVLRRHLERQGYEVTYIQNLTDIDDRMINRAAEEGITVAELGDRFIGEYYKDADALGIGRATEHPRATEHIAEIITLISRLIERGHAYPMDGDVYFDTQSDPEYGKLSGQQLDDLESGARVEVDANKRHPYDFALWKAQKPGEPAWESPWGLGRPGWHIECSAMAMKYLGDNFDIHCGGQDLMFPHHENEVAQSECATGKPFANYWLHNGFINVDNEKMSKSLGNFFTVRDVLQQYDPESVRMFILSAHYRSPVNFSHEMLEQAKSALDRLYTARDNARFRLTGAPERVFTECEQKFAKRGEMTIEAFDSALNDDLNTADALGVMFEYVKDMNIILAEGDAPRGLIKSALDTLASMCGVLGLLTGRTDEIEADVAEMAENRQAARKARDFALADQLRDQIAARGYILEDTPQGPKLRRG